MKQPETQRYIALLKRRVASLRLMAKELLECRDSFTRMDLDATREHIAYQQGLCAEIRSLDDEMRVLRRQIAVSRGLDPQRVDALTFEGLFDEGSAAQLRQVTGELADIRLGVRRLNSVYAGLLRRSRRSVNVLINVMASYAGTYSPSRGRKAWSFPWHART